MIPGRLSLFSLLILLALCFVDNLRVWQVGRLGPKPVFPPTDQGLGRPVAFQATTGLVGLTGWLPKRSRRCSRHWNWVEEMLRQGPENLG